MDGMVTFTTLNGYIVKENNPSSLLSLYLENVPHSLHLCIFREAWTSNCDNINLYLCEFRLDIGQVKEINIVEKCP